MNEIQTKNVLAGMDKAKREKLRRIVLVSTEDDYAIASAVDCNPMHVRAMRDRLIALGVMVKPELRTPPPARKAAARPGKFRNGDLFEDSPHD